MGAIFDPRSHADRLKYKLPNGLMFIRSGTQSRRTAINEYKILQRLLKEPEPEI